MAPFCLHVCVGYINEFAVILCRQLFLSCSEESTMKYIHSEVSQQVCLNGSFQDFYFPCSSLLAIPTFYDTLYLLYSENLITHYTLPRFPSTFFFPMRIGCQQASALSGAIIPHPLHAKASWTEQKLQALLLLKALALPRGDSGILSSGSALIRDRSVFLKSRGFLELDFLSPERAPLLPCLSREAEPCVFWKRELSLPPPVAFLKDSLGADSLTQRVGGGAERVYIIRGERQEAPEWLQAKCRSYFQDELKASKLNTFF